MGVAAVPGQDIEVGDGGGKGRLNEPKNTAQGLGADALVQYLFNMQAQLVAMNGMLDRLTIGLLKFFS